MIQMLGPRAHPLLFSPSVLITGKVLFSAVKVAERFVHRIDVIFELYILQILHHQTVQLCDWEVQNHEQSRDKINKYLL